MILLFEVLHNTPLRATKIKEWVDKNLLCSRVRDHIRRGWGDTHEPEMQPFQSRLTGHGAVQDECILRESWVVVHKQGREAVATLLHEGHPGITRMKRLARGYVWWLGMDADLEGVVKACAKYQEHQKVPAKAPMHPWEWPALGSHSHCLRRPHPRENDLSHCGRPL